MSNNGLKALGKRVTEYTGLETFPNPGSRIVTLKSDEVTAVCPVTGQPDWYEVGITYRPKDKCVESKTVKLFLQSLRNEGMFCEQLAEVICEEFSKYLDCHVVVELTQKPRGGVAINVMTTTEKEPYA